MHCDRSAKALYLEGNGFDLTMKARSRFSTAAK
jgi:hypothetical protein